MTLHALDTPNANLFASGTDAVPDACGRNSPLSYIVVTPAKDEIQYIERTLQSMVAQTHRPLMWIIVDDGSSDGTIEIVQKYAAEHEFIRPIPAERITRRATGTAEVRAFNRGYELARNEKFGCIVKLDADLSFDADYFARLLAHFIEDPKLGIASGIYLEAHSGDNWKEIPMPSYHAAGASKVIRWECFEDISGFIEQRGWDTVDEIRAIARGWRTGHFPELQMKHWKPEGSGMGILRTTFMHGEIYYRTQGSFLFFTMKIIRRLLEKPYLIGGLSMLSGYLHAFFQGREPLVTSAEGKCYRQLLNQRLRQIAGRVLPIR